MHTRDYAASGSSSPAASGLVADRVAAAISAAVTFSGWWQAARWPPGYSARGGSTVRQSWVARGQRVWKRQPVGIFMALGMSSRTRARLARRSSRPAGESAGTEAITLSKAERSFARRSQNSSPPLGTTLKASPEFMMVGTALSGSFVVEVITAWPGLGRLMLDALRARDVYLVAGCAGTGALFLAFGTLLSDLALGLVDPRARE